ncbi:hypothetical protein [Allonocardiopsis opalescens]|uniref:Uncharacterized protein n=1 Tax=Allonocardiopsis opalescens TaxID=1144618 RepID=A0A2T0PPD6_9ACTN|nr:hypothetical protein [Allonocardiopsis opalescens]PRX90668.1 hypothetical protein CLV72_1186 [Allonocardiopsis opalescens]
MNTRAHTRWLADGSIQVRGESFVGARVMIPYPTPAGWESVNGEVVDVVDTVGGQYALVDRRDGSQVVVFYRSDLEES